MDRREALRFIAGALGGLLGGCRLGGTEPPHPAPVPVRSNVIDVHCHFFNGSDLPTVRFIKIVMLHHYPRQAIQTLDIRDPDALDGLLALLTFIVGRTRAPSAVEESQLLEGRAPGRREHGNTPENEVAVVDAIAEFSLASEAAVATAGDVSPRAVRMVRGAVFTAAGESGLATSPREISLLEMRTVAAQAYRSEADLGHYLRWFGLFTRYRHALAESLAATHRKQGFEATLLCPATVDYDHWLGENVDVSPLPAQVAVMGHLARRKDGPAVHGYVAFDPLRQAYFAAGRGSSFEPLELVRRAIRLEGFLGVKLYPPMGFKPFANADDPCQIYHEYIVDDLASGSSPDQSSSGCTPRPKGGSAKISQALDTAMAALFDLCVAEEACVLAHANESNDGGKDYARRADPHFWAPVFRRWPRLRVALAHFGHFNHRSAGAPHGSALPESSWEWTLGRAIRESNDPPIFADISYLTEVLHGTADQVAQHAAIMRRWIGEFDRDCRHLMFGTDWTMLGVDPAYERYTHGIYEYFRSQCGFDSARLDRLYFGNAARFLGVRQGDAARARIAEFYRRHGVPAKKLPAFAS